MYKKIVVPLDGSKLAECVLPHIENIVKGSGTEEIILITVTERVAGLLPKNNVNKPDENSGEFQPAVAFADRPYSARPFEIDPSLKMPVVTGKVLKQGQRYLAKIAEQLGKKGIKTGIAVLMGARFKYQTSEDVFNEIASHVDSFGGMSYRKLGNKGALLKISKDIRVPQPA